jgi:iron-sulfur cluster insertion protein
MVKLSFRREGAPQENPMQTTEIATPNTPVPQDGPDLTAAAIERISALIEEEGNPDLKLRAFVQGGGCSGFEYGFTFDELINDDDFVINRSPITLLVDSMSIQYLRGAKIDFQEDLSGARFVIVNPNATTTCGCGSSFSVD